MFVASRAVMAAPSPKDWPFRTLRNEDESGSRFRITADTFAAPRHGERDWFSIETDSVPLVQRLVRRQGLADETRSRERCAFRFRY